MVCSKMMNRSYQGTYKAITKQNRNTLDSVIGRATSAGFCHDLEKKAEDSFVTDSVTGT